jgi:uncharacterized protein with HEPN domain
MNQDTRDKELVLFLLDQIEMLHSYLENKNEYDFYNDNILKDACFAKLFVIGEYAKRISDKTKQSYPQIEWGVMLSARNFYAHGYGTLDWTQVWDTLHKEIPKLKIEFQVILNDL